jgi:sirohydrochlorin cobaltochelatase
MLSYLPLVVAPAAGALLGAALALFPAAPALAQTPAAPLAAQTPAPVGTVLIAHGGDSLWNAGVLEAARQANTGGPLEVAFLMGPAAKTHRFQDAVAKLEAAGAQRIVVVPMLVSSHSGHFEQIRYLTGRSDTLSEMMHHHLHMSGIERPSTTRPMQLTPALDDAAELATVLADRARAMAAQVGDAPSQRALLIVGHGPESAEDYAQWMANLRPVAARVQALTGFRDVRVELVRDDAPAAVRAEAVLRTRELITLQAGLTGKDVLVVPVLVSKGVVSRSKVRSDIAGTPSVYTGEALLPHDAMARWVERRVREAGAVTTAGAR